MPKNYWEKQNRWYSDLLLKTLPNSFPQVRWYRDTMLLEPNEYRLMEKFGIRHTLVLRKVSEADFGNYSCRAENKLGRSRAFIEVSGNSGGTLLPEIADF